MSKNIPKKNLYFYILDFIKDNNRLPLEEYSKQKINYYTSTLKRLGIIYKIGYNVWNVDIDKYKKYRFNIKTKGKKSYGVTTDTPNKKFLRNPLNKVRGHGFCFTMPINIEDWERREQYMLKENIKYKNIPQGHRIYIKKNKVWLCKRSIVVYFHEDLSFYGETALQTLDMAKSEMIYIIKKLERLFKLNLDKGSGYGFKVSRNHYAILKDLIAKESNKQGGIKVYYEGELFFITDKSFRIDEGEMIHAKDGISDTDTYMKTIHNIKDYGKTYGEAPNFVEMRKIFEQQLQMNQIQTQTIKQQNDQITELTTTLNSLLYKKPEKLSPRDSYFG